MRSKSLRRALYIAYEFPPMGGVSSIWAGKFVKYLPSFGWEPVVVTVRDAPTNLMDRGLLDELPRGLRVERAYSLEPTRLVRFAKRLKRSVEKGKNHGECNNLVYSYTGLQFKSLVKLRAVFIPDEKIGWFPFALVSSLRAIRETGAEVIFSTAPPFSTHIIAAAVKKITGLPWVCEMRDPLVDYTLAAPPTAFNRKLNAHLEKYIVHNADAVICAMPGILDGLAQRYPDVEKNRYHVITGGYDPDDFTGDLHLEDKFTMTWIGTMYGDLCPRGLFAALRQLMDKDAIDTGDFVVIVVGTMDVEALTAVRDAGLGDFVELAGFVEHEESIKRMRASHLLLMQLGAGRVSEIVYAGKMFEYFAAMRPILALAYEGATSELVEEMGAGVVVRPDDVDAVGEVILRYYSRYKSGEVDRVGNPQMIERFDKRDLSARLAGIFDMLTGVAGSDS